MYLFPTLYHVLWKKYFYTKVDYIIYFFFLRVLEILLASYVHIFILILNNFCIISILLCFFCILCE